MISTVFNDYDDIPRLLLKSVFNIKDNSDLSHIDDDLEIGLIEIFYNYYPVENVSHDWNMVNSNIIYIRFDCEEIDKDDTWHSEHDINIWMKYTLATEKFEHDYSVKKRTNDR